MTVKAAPIDALSNLFVPITKIDEENRIVYGLATFEGVDKANEIWDYDGSKPYFEAWSANAEKTSNGKSLGNLRSMHASIAAGKLVQFVPDDATKSISIAAKVVDDGEWTKVLEGVYTGFSQGGKYIKRWKDPTDSTKTRFISDPVEISLVDLPCLPGAEFEYVKADGTSEMRKFNTPETEKTMYEPTNEEVAARADALAQKSGKAAFDHFEEARELLKAEHASGVSKAAEASETPAATVASETPVDVSTVVPSDATDAPAAKAADAPAVVEPVTVTDEQREAAQKALVQVWKAPDGTTHAKKSDALAHALGEPTPPASAVEAALEKARKAVSGETDPEPVAWPLQETHEAATKWAGVLKEANALDGKVAKGLWTVSRLADMLESLACITSSAAYEAEYEKDGSGVPAQLLEGLQTLGAALVAMAQEEVAEIVAEMADRGVGIEAVVDAGATIVALSAAAEMVKADTALMEKAGARNSRKDGETIQKMHDGAVDLGAICGGDAEKMTKAVEGTSVFKNLQAENERLSGEVTKALGGIEELTKAIETMKAQPMPVVAPRTQVVGKTDGVGEVAKSESDANALITEMRKSPEGQRMLAEAALRGVAGVAI